MNRSRKELLVKDDVVVIGSKKICKKSVNTPVKIREYRDKISETCEANCQLSADETSIDAIIEEYKCCCLQSWTHC